MALSANQKSYLKYLASIGDLQAAAIVECIDTGTEKIVVLTDVPAKSAVALSPTAFGAATTNFGVASMSPTAFSTPRNIQAAFGASWWGGDITVQGLDQFGVAATEVLGVTNANTFVGSKAFSRVSAISKAYATGVATGPNAVILGTGDKLALGTVKLHNSFCQLLTNNVVPTAAPTLDMTNNTILPNADIPNGTNDYQVLVRSSGN